MPYTRFALDNMAILHGETEYDPELFKRVQSCMEEMSEGDFDLVSTTEKSWKGFLEYGMTEGQPDGSDQWGKEEGESWIEYEPTPLTSDNSTYPGAADILVYEPCNYVSNMAYYRTLVEMCERQVDEAWTLPRDHIIGLAQSYSALGMGSAFFHASSTALGGSIDNKPIGFLALLIHQGSLSSIPWNPILHELRQPDAPARSMTAVGYANEMTRMLNEDSVYTWDATLRALDEPNYYLTFGAIVASIFDVLLQDSPETVIKIVEAVGNLILNPNDVVFLTDVYLPELQRVRVDLGLTASGIDRAMLGDRGVGTLVKMIYAFIWQEEILPGDHLNSIENNIKGAEMMPVINGIANEISGYFHSDRDLQDSIGVYPGDAKCRVEQPHSKWHEESGNGLMDLMLTGQTIDRILRNPGSDDTELEFGALFCLVENDCLEGVSEGSYTKAIGCMQYIPIINRNPPCGDKVDLISLTRCVAGPAVGCKDGDKICLVKCMMENAQLGVDIVEK